jgi:hypothetical protein
MPYSITGKNAMLEALGVTHVSAHTGAPGATGVNEVTGSPYARQSITYSAAAAGAKDSSNLPEIPIPAGNTVTSIGYWSASTGGSFLAHSVITDEIFGSNGTLQVTDSDLSITD